MQEQHHYKATPDQGWSGMLTLLDQAMPVERHSRRFILFWWTAAAVSSAALVALFALMKNDGTSRLAPLAKQEVQNAPSQSRPEMIINDQDMTAGNTSAKESRISTENNKSTIPGINNPTSDSKDKRTSNTPIDRATRNERKLMEDENVTGTYAKESGQIKLLDNKVDPEAGADPSERQIIDLRMDRSGEVIEFIPAAAFVSLEFSDDPIGDIQPARISRYNQKRDLITPYLSAGIMNGYKNGFGFQGSAGINLNILPGLSLTSGLGYNIYNPDASIFGCVCSDEFNGANGLLKTDLGNYNIGDYLAAEEVNNATGSALNPFIQNIRQWQLSAGLKFDLSRRFFTEGGATFGFGTTAKSSYPIIAFNNSIPVTGDLLSVSRSFNSYDVIKSTSTSIYAGLGYRLSPKAEVYAQFTRSFDHYLLNDSSSTLDASERTDYIQGLNVGLRYNLQGP